MNKQKWITLLAFAVVILVPLALFLYWSTKERPTVDILPVLGQKSIVESTDSLGNPVTDTVYHTIPDFKFLSHMGDTVGREVMAGKVVIIDFFFTECKGICIPMSKNMARLQEEFIAEDNVFLLSHTVDPERDSVAKLYDYAQLYDVNPGRWLLLTGPKKDLYDIARKGYMITAGEGDGGPDDFIHSERFVLVDKEGRIRGYYDGTSDESIEKLSLDTKKLLVSYVLPPKKQKKKDR